jgi:hypothetical protein
MLENSQEEGLVFDVGDLMERLGLSADRRKARGKRYSLPFCSPPSCWPSQLDFFLRNSAVLSLMALIHRRAELQLLRKLLGF